MKLQFVVISALIGILSLSGFSAGAQYTVIDLGSLGGMSYGYGLNDYGQVVGACEVSNGDTRGFLYENGHMTDIDYGYANAINNNAQIIGSNYRNGYLYQNGTMTMLGDDKFIRVPYGINNHGQIVGDQGEYNGSNGNVFIYDNGSITTINTLPGYYNSWGVSINNNGQVAVNSHDYDGLVHSFLYENGSLKDLGTLGGSTTQAYAINDFGQIVGWSATQWDGHAFIYQNEIMTDLGTLGGEESQALDINNKGQVVGWSYAPHMQNRAFLFEDGQMFDLNTLIDPGSGWVLKVATGINENGWIVGTGTNPNGEGHAYLLIPEPASILLLAFGMALLRKNK